MDERIQLAVSIVRTVEQEVKSHLFPAYDTDLLCSSPVMQQRFQHAVDNVVRVYCAHLKQAVVPTVPLLEVS